MARPRQVSTSTVKKSAPANTARWAEMNYFQVVLWHRFGAGAMPYRLSMFATVLSDIRWLRLAKAPPIRSYPQPKFSLAIRTIRVSVLPSMGGWPG